MVPTFRKKDAKDGGTLLLLVSAIKPTDHFIVKIKFKLKLKLKLKGLTPSTALRAGFLAEGREKEGNLHRTRQRWGRLACLLPSSIRQPRQIKGNTKI